MKAGDGTMFEYVGNLHVHSTYSDGTGTVTQIVEAAQKAGIDFVGINDHRTLAALRNGEEGWHGPVLVLVGMESNDRYHHYLSYGIKEEVADNTEYPQAVIDQVADQGGIGFIAHPFENGSPLVQQGTAYTWNDWAVTGFTGICIWNYCSQWRDGITSFSTALYCTYLNRHARISGPSAKTLAKWDQLNQERKVVAIGGSDAHAVQLNYGPFKPVIFPYEFLFRCVNTHVLLPRRLSGQLDIDKALVYSALKNGNCFVAFDYYVPARGFVFRAENGLEQVLMGEKISLRGGVTLEVLLPYRATVKIIRNGTPVLTQKGKVIKYEVQAPGVYRVEAYLKLKPWGKLKPWVYSNPIYVS